ncbi:hypothetical protein J0X15_13735, partial [Roseibium sp. CAU 1637]
HRVDLAQQVISGDKLIERHNLERCLGRAGLLQHQNSESKKNRQTPEVCQQSEAARVGGLDVV